MNEASRLSKLLIFGAYLALVISILSVLSAACEPAKKSYSSKPEVGTATNRPMAPPTDTGNVKQPATHLEEFKGCVNKGGSPAEKRALSHVTKLSGMHDWNGTLDNPKAFTDWTGGMERLAEATLIASAFADCYRSNNGLITVYTSDGHVAGVGRF